jgi:hypothetical protein
MYVTLHVELIGVDLIQNKSEVYTEKICDFQEWKRI